MIKRIEVAIFMMALTLTACKPLKEFSRTPAFEAGNNFNYRLPDHDGSKKTIVVIANNDGTELFDMMAPYYLFNNTGKANVYIIAKNKYPIVMKKGFFVLPQLSFSEVDSLHIRPDVMVIPFLSVADSIHQDPVIINWIRTHYTANTKILAVCDGAATAAATGIFDGRPITAHASDLAGIKKYFSKPLWIQNTPVAYSGNLYSTAGVSNAVDGSLMLIKELFGTQVMSNVAANIQYPGSNLKTTHQSNFFHFRDKLTAGKKIIFKKNKDLAVQLQDGINEFELAAVMDTYNRSFPKSIESFSADDQPVKTKYGLQIIPSGKKKELHPREVHIIGSAFLSPGKEKFSSAKLVTYTGTQHQYIIDRCLQRIQSQYGKKFAHVVKLMLDYN